MLKIYTALIKTTTHDLEIKDDPKTIQNIRLQLFNLAERSWESIYLMQVPYNPPDYREPI